MVGDRDDGWIRARDVGVCFDVEQRPAGGGGTTGTRRHWALRHVDVAVPPGQICGLIGRNGAGKTTLLRTLAGIYEPDEGAVHLGGDVAPVLALSAGVRVGLSAWENVELAGILMGWSRHEIRRMSPQVIELAGLEEFASAPLRVYSAGMRARLGFALATFVPSPILLLDEIFAVGDEEFRTMGAERLRRLVRDGRTVLMSGHDMAGLSDLADRVVHLDGGRVVDDGAPDEVVDRYTRQLQGSARRDAPDGEGASDERPGDVGRTAEDTAKR